MTSSAKSPRAFSLLELLVVIWIIAILAVLAVGVGSRAIASANQADSLARLRTVGQAILLHAADHNSVLPGPLWPGQVMLYDPAREGRMVRDLSSYLGVENRDAPYLVNRMIPKAYLRNTTAGAMQDVRIYVLNSVIVQDGQTNRPFGALTTTPSIAPMPIVSLSDLPADERWMISETDRQHPDVINAPWKANTPERPVHGQFRVSLNFDGSAGLEIVE